MAVTHGFIINETATSVTAPLNATAGLQVVVGTAPVNMLDDPAAAVNTPMIVRSYKEAVEAAGYSDDFEDYTICEAVNASFQVMNVGPLVLINVLDPAKHTTAVEETAVQVNDGVAEVDVTGLLLAKLVVKKEATELTADVDYAATFNDDGTVSIALIEGGAGDGATQLLVSGTKLDPSKVTADDIVGGVSISTGAETGLEVVRQVYPKIGYVPGILLAPRFSRNANVCAALQAKCRSINSVFNCVCFVDIDSTAEGAVKYQDVAAQKVAQAATSREAYGLWPYCKVGDVVYSGSSMAAAVTVYNDTQYGDVPNASPSNVTAPITAACLADGTEVLIDQEQGNVLNENGIATWVRAQSRFVLWGNETCAYPSTTDPKDMFLCIRRFFNYTAANFVLNNQQKLDKPMNKRLLESIIDSENMRGQVYVSTGVCASYELFLDPDRNTEAELVAGHIYFCQYCTPFPPMKLVTNTMEYQSGALATALLA